MGKEIIDFINIIANDSHTIRVIVFVIIIITLAFLANRYLFTKKDKPPS